MKVLEVVFIRRTICLTHSPLLCSSGASYASRETDSRNKQMVSEEKKKKKKSGGGVEGGEKYSPIRSYVYVYDK